MKKIVSPIPNGGYPFTADAFLVAHDGLYETIQKLYGTVASTWVVTGCDVQTIASSSGATINSGYVFLGNELRYFPQTTTTSFPVYIIAANSVYDQDLYGNSALQNVFVTKSATVTSVKPAGTDNYLVVDPNAVGGDDTVNKRLRPLINGPLTASLAAEIQARKDADDVLRKAIVDEAATRGSADTQLQANIDALTTVVNTKQNRISGRVPWQNINLDNPYYHSVDDTNDPYRFGALGALYNMFQMMRTEDGIIHVRGYLRGNGGGYLVNAGNLPAQFRPKATVQFEIPYITDGNNAYPGKVTTIHRIEIDSLGQVVHSQSMSQFINQSGDPGALQLLGFQPWFVLDGCCYSVE